jgi:glycerol-3-phosphate dehydrogenase
MNQTVKHNSEHIFDVIIIGGGITGAGIALDLASRGIKNICLVEKNDFASGTSSRSTKLIHGGLRYLKQLHLKIVHEVGKERRIVHKLAPNIVIPEKMILPISKSGSLGYYSTSIALLVYDLLANVKGDDKRKMLTTSAILKMLPGLKKEGLVGGCIYSEYRADDARLTLEIIKKSKSLGAVVHNYIEVKNIVFEENIYIVKVVDNIDNQSFILKSKSVVNAAGPWVDTVIETTDKDELKHLALSKGVHIVVSKNKLSLPHSIYFDTQDGRMIFCIPRENTTYIGTTDTFYKGDIDHVYTQKDEAQYLIDAVNNIFENLQLTVNEIESSWAGLRPLIYQEGKSSSELSREDEVFISKNGMISIAGGKLTGYRLMAKKIADLVERKFNNKASKCITHTLQLSDDPFLDYNAVLKFKAALLLEFPIFAAEIDRLVLHYGKNAAVFLQKAASSKEDKIYDLLQLELTYCIEHEQVKHILDFLNRRTGILYFDIEKAKKYGIKLATFLKIKLNYSDETLRNQIDKLQKEIELITLEGDKNG